MLFQKSFRVALLGGILVCTASVFAQDSGALIEALVRKGILTNQEAENIRADLVRESNTIPSAVFAGGKSTDRLSIGMRLQAQFANLNTDITNAPDPAATSHFFLRRAYLTLKAGLGADWSAVFTYDFAGSSYDDAIVEWKPTNDLTFDFGLRKVNLAFEERGSSADIKSIERSPITRYFVEANNGRRLGAASYRIGVFLDGKKDIEGTKTTLVYSAAVTNPERADTFTIASATGDNTNNNFAYFGNVGVSGKFTGGNYLVGVGAGYLPDQGGASNTNLGKGFDLALYSVYSSLTYGKFGFRGEYLMANVEGGVSATQDAKPVGFYLEPAYLITEKIEAVFRYSHLDTDHRGVNLSDGVRSAPSGGTMNKLTEYYVGGNWYLKGNDLKFQLGFIYGQSKDTVTGAPAEAKVYGIRSQLQTNF